MHMPIQSIASNQYWVICPDRVGFERYFQKISNMSIVNSLPSLPDEGFRYRFELLGKGLLEEGEINANMHAKFIQQKEGISLERVDPKNHLFFSSANPRGASPGEINSQQIQKQTNNHQLEILPKAFSPNQDGFEDLVSICLPEVSEQGIIQVRIYNAFGIEARHLAKSELATLHTCLVWDGTLNSGMLAPPGAYIVAAEYHDQQQKHATWLGSVVVAAEN